MMNQLSVIGILCGLAVPAAAADLWDLPPLNYSETAASDPVASLAASLAAGTRTIEGSTPLERLRFVLKLLDVPAESQILVFSKTSKQNSLIHPGHPRAIYFNEHSYVGYVPGGLIEVIAHDPLLGVVFYHIDPGSSPRQPVIQRDNSDCLSCHGTARTESVPGMLVRSVYPDVSGQPVLPLGSFLTTQTSPINERWGGYYVTGHSSLPHLGNRTYQESVNRPPATASALADLTDTIDTAPYLRPTSDVVALMVLEHQCALHNQFTAAAIQYRRLHWLQKSLDPNADPATGSAGRQADHAAIAIVDSLLFKGEASLGEDGIEGDPAFQEQFTARFPKTPEGRSLAEFNLNDRLFKHRCSFMIHSKPFAAMPDRVKSAVFQRLHAALQGPEAATLSPHLKPQERARIADILRSTVPGFAPDAP